MRPAESGRRPRAHSAPKHQRLVPRATNAGALPAVIPPRDKAKRKVLELLASGVDMYSGSTELSAAVDTLIQSNPAAQPGPDSLALGQGTWEVFHAPHIARLSRVLAGTRFQPIRYILEGTGIVSNVRYSNPLLGSGWLSAAGSIEAKDSSTLELDFQRFWVDLGADQLRPDVLDTASNLSQVDQFIMSCGRALFFPQFATFPVLYLDGDLAVFEFTPLKSSIAIRRVDPTPSMSAGAGA